MAPNNSNTARSQSSLSGSVCPFSVKTQKCFVIGSAINAMIVALAVCMYLYMRPVPSDVVHTKLGAVQGAKGWSRNGNEFNQFLGMPYAEPPIGDLRFEPPQPALPWAGVRDASFYRSLCLQVESFATGFISGQEDCLYLNVFVPKSGRSSDKSVMVYIHGGVFHVGGSDFAGPKYFMDEDIILVTINYRLGVFGFLSTGDEVISGNMGLKDQNMALRWVQTNIRFFGGNPNKVTIFGESAGAASVHHHVISPMSKGLFHRAIHQSGSSINYWAVYRNVKEQAQRFAAKFSCPVSTSEEIAACLKSLDGNLIVEAHRELLDLVYRQQITTFVPTIEVPTAKSPFLTEEPKKLLEAGKFARIPLMAGMNSNEGLLISNKIMANQTKLNDANDWYKFAPWSLHYPESLTNVSKKLYEFYFGDAKAINDTKFHQGFTDLFGDRLFIVRSAVAARIQSKFTPTYFYYYDYNGTFSAGEIIAHAQGDYLPSWMNVGMYVFKKWVLQQLNMLPKKSGSACHSDEGFLLLQRDFMHKISQSHPDYEMSTDLVKLWVSFAQDVPVMHFRNVEWPPVFGSGEVKYLKINEQPEIIKEPFEKRRLFWESLNLPDL